MKCAVCHSPSGRLEKFPFKLRETLLRNSYDHKAVFLHECLECGSLYIGLSIQAYDDHLSYWVQATAEEILTLQNLRGSSDLFASAKAIIESKDLHIYGSHEGFYYKKLEPVIVHDHMPPW
ncbi:MAG: hypothetical protein PQJ50_15140 [Spirochaetales bacterium]|nr:hypothetical protein [Spirochaetales bacterium]